MNSETVNTYTDTNGNGYYTIGNSYIKYDTNVTVQNAFKLYFNNKGPEHCDYCIRFGMFDGIFQKPCVNCNIFSKRHKTIHDPKIITEAQNIKSMNYKLHKLPHGNVVSMHIRFNDDETESNVHVLKSPRSNTPTSPPTLRLQHPEECADYNFQNEIVEYSRDRKTKYTYDATTFELVCIEKLTRPY